MFDSYIKLGIAALIPVALTAVLYALSKRFPAKDKKDKIVRQIFTGLFFGAAAIIGTEWGIPMNGAMVNCRDAAVLCAGLLFGGPAGIIAGLIGGIERWIAVAWGVGTYTRLACSISTIIAGIYAALLRKYMFDDKKPGWFMALAIGVVMEVFHLTMVFITNINDAAHAAEVVQVCSIPMIIGNSVSVMLATIVVSLIVHEKLTDGIKSKQITQKIQRWLLVFVVLAFAVTTVFMDVIQHGIATNNGENLLRSGITDVEADILEASDKNIRNVAYQVANDTYVLDIQTIAANREIAEISVIDSHGIITESTNPDFIGFDMASGPQSAAFLSLLGDQLDIVQEYGPISYDNSIWRKYAGVKFRDGFIQVGYDLEAFQKDIANQVDGATKNRHVGNTGMVIIADSNGKIISAPTSLTGNLEKHLSDIGLTFSSRSTPILKMFESTVNGELCSCMYDYTEGYYIISVITQAEMFQLRNTAIYVNSFLEVLVFALMFALIYMLIKNVVVNSIRRVNGSLSKITEGDLTETVDVRSSAEFASLSDDINSTVDTLKHYIDEAAARIDKELEFAKNIQHSALPSEFPAFPKRKEFDIYALMDTAKEVGGDFYDFYFTKQNIINFLIADVSGKGIPAALFMMRSKVQLKSLTESDLPVSEVFTRGNERLCEGNDAGMFVTAWEGCLNLDTGVVQFANAGHNPPLVRKNTGEWEYLKSRVGLVLAGMEGLRYKPQELQLEPGETIFLYTDGVTEATDANEELYGEDRLINYLNSREFSSVKELCEGVKEDVDAFVGEADQFDDITMLAVYYAGPQPKPQIHFEEADIDDIPAVTEFIEAELEKMECPMKEQIQINVAIDELYSNIARYAYGKRKGPATVTITEADDPHGAIITFKDSGMPYNPLKKEDPDTTLSAEERDIGGLGIFMVKKSMDEMSYEYKNDCNILTIRKNF